MILPVELPVDIWIHISCFIPSNVLRDLYSVNRPFFELALNERYRDVDFLQVKPKTLHLLRHLKDPNIAIRVRSLRVNPVWFNLHPTALRTSLPTRVILRLRSEIERQIGRGQGSLNNGRTGTSWNSKNQRELIDAFTTSLVSSFPNVTSFTIVSRYFPHPQSLSVFLLNCWTTFGSKLGRLTINAPLGSIKELLPDPNLLVSLEELTLRFSTDMMSADEEIDTVVLGNDITPFLRVIGPQLRRLNIMSSALGDHSEVFAALGRFPRLSSLSLDIGFYPPLLSDPSGLTRFLHLNDNIQHVRFQPHTSFRSPPTTGSAHRHFSQWMFGSASYEHLLNNLRSFVVSTSNELASSDLFDTTSIYIQRSKDTLTSVVLGDPCLSFSQLTALVDMFAHRSADKGLKNFHIKVISLSPQLFDLVAERLPGLDDLEIRFKCLLPNAEEESSVPQDDQAPNKEDIEVFLEQMAGRAYTEWSLYSLWIWQRSYMTTKTAHEILKSLKLSIPSVQVISKTNHAHYLASIFN